MSGFLILVKWAEAELMRASRTIYLVKRLETRSRLMLDEALGELGLTAGQYTILSFLAGRVERSSAELARQALITPQSMSEVIGGLEKKGLIERRSSAANRRIMGIRLSAEGRRLLARAEGLVDELEGRLFGPLDPASLSAFRDLMCVVLEG